MDSNSDEEIIQRESMNESVDSVSSSRPPSPPRPTPQPTTPKSSKYVTIDGNKYDITNFKHPGGNIIRMVGDNEDATDVFNEYHYRSTKAKHVLQSLPKCAVESAPDVSPRQKEMLSDFRDMRTTLVNNGCFEPDYIHVYFRLMEIMFYFGLGTILAPHNIYASILSFTIFKTRCAWLQHEAGHNSLTGIIKIDKIIHTLTIGVGNCISSSLWNTVHNKHHAFPQRIKHDIDLETTPFMAFHKNAFEENTNGQKTSKFMNRWWMRLQAWLYIPVINGIMIHFVLLYYFHPLHAYRIFLKNYTKNWIELFSLILSHTIIPYIYWSYGGYSIITAYLLLMICNYCMNSFMFGHFALSHTHTGVIPENNSLLWFEYAVRHSVNISTKSAWVSWLMGYLNFQIEHHLFPSMPQYKNALAMPYVRAFCAKWHVPGEYELQYTELGYIEGWRRVFSNLNEVGKHYFHHGIGDAGGHGGGGGGAGVVNEHDGIDDKIKLD